MKNENFLNVEKESVAICEELKTTKFIDVDLSNRIKTNLYSIKESITAIRNDQLTEELNKALLNLQFSQFEELHKNYEKIIPFIKNNNANIKFGESLSKITNLISEKYIYIALLATGYIYTYIYLKNIDKLNLFTESIISSNTLSITIFFLMDIFILPILMFFLFTFIIKFFVTHVKKYLNKLLKNDNCIIVLILINSLLILLTSNVTIKTIFNTYLNIAPDQLLNFEHISFSHVIQFYIVATLQLYMFENNQYLSKILFNMTMVFIALFFLQIVFFLDNKEKINKTMELIGVRDRINKIYHINNDYVQNYLEDNIYNFTKHNDKNLSCGKIIWSSSNSAVFLPKTINSTQNNTSYIIPKEKIVLFQKYKDTGCETGAK